MTKDPCGTCGSTTYYTWQKTGDVEACNHCSRVTDNAPRDAWGNKVNVPASDLGVWHDGANCVVQSSRQFADVLKKNNWRLKHA
jgi:hypothetical protein